MPLTDLAAILTNAALAPIDDRAFLRITGEDRTRWLNGMVTNSAQALTAGEGNENFLLNAQGRIQGTCTLWCEAEEFLLETTRDQVAEIQQHLDKFIIMDDVELMPIMDDQHGLLLAGPHAAEHLASLSLPTPESQHFARASHGGQPVIVFAPRAPQVPLFELWAAPETTAALRLTLEASAVAAASAEAVEQLRILSGTPRYHVDLNNTHLPQETAQDHTLHFNKGCYLGQEIVERIRSRGQVNKSFTLFKLEGELPTLPSDLVQDGRSVGQVTSAAELPLPSGPLKLALGFARREALDGKLPFDYNGGTASQTTSPPANPQRQQLKTSN